MGLVFDMFCMFVVMCGFMSYIRWGYQSVYKVQCTVHGLHFADASVSHSSAYDTGEYTFYDMSYGLNKFNCYIRKQNNKCCLCFAYCLFVFQKESIS